VADLLSLVIPAALATFIVAVVQALLLGIAAVLGHVLEQPEASCHCTGDGARPSVRGRSGQ
jgi:hypothetical protein